MFRHTEFQKWGLSYHPSQKATEGCAPLKQWRKPRKRKIETGILAHEAGRGERQAKGQSQVDIQHCAKQKRQPVCIEAGLKT